MTVPAERLTALAAEMEAVGKELGRDDVTADDLGPIMGHLQVLIDQARNVAVKACKVYDAADADHPVRAGFDSSSLDVGLGNISRLLDVTQSITYDTVDLVRNLNPDPS